VDKGVVQELIALAASLNVKLSDVFAIEMTHFILEPNISVKV